MNDRANGIALVLIWLLNYIDGIFTIVWVQMGVAVEANPLMEGLIDTPTTMLLVKTTLVTLGCFILWRFRAFGLSQLMITLALICYLLILALHTDIALSLEHVPHEQVKACLESFS